MKVYFSATITENNELKNSYKEIIETLKKQGHKVLEYGSDQIEPQNLLNRNEEEIKKVYKELDNFLKQADVYIAEISQPSIGIGYEISQAISNRKPVLALNHKHKSDFQPLATIEGNKSKYLQHATYTEGNLKNIVNDFLNTAKQKLDTKFILIIPAEIDRYLEWASDYKRMHKAQIVRNAIENYMEKDEEWQEFLTSE